MGLIALIKNNVVIIAAHAARFSACFRQDAQRSKLGTKKFPSYLVLLFSTFHETCRATTRHVSRHFPGILPLTALRLLATITYQAGKLSQFNKPIQHFSTLPISLFSKKSSGLLRRVSKSNFLSWPPSLQALRSAFGALSRSQIQISRRITSADFYVF